MTHYGFPLKSRTEPERRGWLRKEFTRGEQIVRARSNLKASERKLMLAQEAVFIAINDVSNAKVVLEKLEAESNEDPHETHLGAG